MCCSHGFLKKQHKEKDNKCRPRDNGGTRRKHKDHNKICKKNLKYVKTVQHSQRGLEFTKNIGSEFAEISITTVQFIHKSVSDKGQWFFTEQDII